MSQSEHSSGMEDSGSEDEYDHYGRPSRRRKTPLKFLHTMTELEDEANSIVIKDCKLDACLDVFLAGLLQLGIDRSLDMYSRLPDFKEFSGETLEALKEDLRRNLDRLLPGFISSDTSILENKVFKKSLEKRFTGIWRDDFRYGHGRSNDSEKDDTTQTIPVSLFEILMEKQAKERSTKGQGSQPDSVTDSQATLTEYCRRLKDSIDSEEANGCFVCGGTIPVDVNPIHPRNEGDLFPSHYLLVTRSRRNCTQAGASP
ncbi:uncharacterized protein LDX57_003778 [Aspergillus melleus]|uniref:uncharacterized protein n=1 Tax=Aspergillus melleus TaxID=138277 RepID=UPI001E8EC7D9|nr:uncharacterized protein LDX57_003778 [Aspergillus melleus]KAH8426038.1 hypothetical protein LDX57_003778 [Aspergillus melleus]